jgi:hypothetical protein
VATTALATLSQKLIKRAAPPSLRDLRDLLLTSENYAEFMRIVTQFTPEIEAEVRRAAGAAAKMMLFANTFEQRYFPLYPGFADGLNDDYYDLCTQIPVVTLSIDWDAYHEIAEGQFRKGLMLAAYILADPYGNADSPEGERVALADACGQLVRKEDLARVPPGGISHDDVHKLLDGTRFEALATVGDILNFDTGDCFHDNDEEMVAQGGPELDWTRENVEAIAQGWLKAQATEEKVGKFYDWLQEDMPAHFAELLDFIEERKKKRATRPAKVAPAPVFKPRKSDVDWLVAMVRNLSIGGIWKAPMGFTFEKVGEDHLRLMKASTSPKLRADALEVINRTVLVGKEGGIRVDTDVLDENMSCPGKMIGGVNDANTRTSRAPMELAAVAGGSAGPTEGQIRLL